MTDAPEDAPPNETPMQRALRLKKAAQAARSGPNRGSNLRDEQRAAAARSSSKNKPWMTR